METEGDRGRVRGAVRRRMALRRTVNAPVDDSYRGGACRAGGVVWVAGKERHGGRLRGADGVVLPPVPWRSERFAGVAAAGSSGAVVIASVTALPACPSLARVTLDLVGPDGVLASAELTGRSAFRAIACNASGRRARTVGDRARRWDIGAAAAR